MSSDAPTLPAEYRNQIICGDSLAVMRQMPDECVDLVVTSPPYNLRNTVGGGLAAGGDKWRMPAIGQGYDAWSDNLPYTEYITWQRACLTEMLRLIPKHGAIFYNHKWRVQGGLLQDRREIVSGFPLRQILVWKRPGGVNFSRSFFLPTYEVVYVIAKPNFRLIPKANALGDVWSIAPDRGNPHPAPFPLTLPLRIIGATDARTVLDPFIGSGTTGVAASKLGRMFVGIDNSPA